MDLIIIFKQRKESYPEEFAPEVHAACTEFELEDGAAEWMDKQEKEAKLDTENVAVRRFRLKFPDAFRAEIRKGLLDPQLHTKCEGVEPE